jgi:DNA-binding response OmpR family regulator
MGAGRRGIVLVVENHADTRELYFHLLTGAGYRCVTTDTPSGALRRASLVRFDAVILDLGLPTLAEGMALARSLRALPDPPPLVAITGHPVAERDTTGLFAVQFLKPADPDEIMGAVARAIGT